jgi:hypothetical protein
MPKKKNNKKVIKKVESKVKEEPKVDVRTGHWILCGYKIKPCDRANCGVPTCWNYSGVFTTP